MLKSRKYDASKKEGLAMWAIYAVLSALFASLTAIFGKIGVREINSTLATAIRTIFVLLMAWGMVFITGVQSGIRGIDGKGFLFLALSGVATGASWLFYYKALSAGVVAKVVAIDKFSLVLTFVLAALLLGERLTPKALLGGLLVTLGTLIVAL